VAYQNLESFVYAQKGKNYCEKLELDPWMQVFDMSELFINTKRSLKIAVVSPNSIHTTQNAKVLYPDLESMYQI
jgi:hypothetical protein